MNGTGGSFHVEGQSLDQASLLRPKTARISTSHQHRPTTVVVLHLPDDPYAMCQNTKHGLTTEDLIGPRLASLPSTR